MNNILRADGLHFAYPGASPLLNGVDLEISIDDRIALLGAMGSGKSTLLYLLMGLLKPSSGTVRLFGLEMIDERAFAAVRTRVGFLFQNSDDQLFSPTVMEDIAFGPLNQGFRVTEAREKSFAILEGLGIADLAETVTHHLSGGQKRLVALASVLVMEPEILLLDEPVSGLDRDARTRFIDLLKGLDLPMLMVSHDWDFLHEVANRYTVLEEGIMHSVDKAVLHPHIHAHPSGETGHSHGAYFAAAKSARAPEVLI